MAKKKLTTLLCCTLACLALVGLAACSQPQGTAAPEAEASTEKLVVGYDNSYPPYGFIGDDGQPTGLDLDLAKAVCDRLGWEFECQAIDWDAKDALMNQGSINCIWNGFTMEGREDKYTFSDPYMLNEQVVVVRKDSGIQGLPDLAGKTVATQVDSAALEVLEGDKADLSATFGSLDQLSDYNNAFAQLESGLVDAVACDLSIAAYQLSANPDAFVQLADPLSTEHYAVGFKLGDTDRAEKVTQALRDLTADGTAKEICDKYADYGVDYEGNWTLK